MPKTVKSRERILGVAAQVFYHHGYRATGVEAIATAAGVTKATLYHHFRNKDELIEESLKYLSDFHRRSYMEVWNKKGLKPLQKLTILFDEMERFFRQPDCFGCPFLNAASEYSDRESEVRKICAAHYQFLCEHLEQFAREADLSKPKEAANQIAAAIAGTYSFWLVGGADIAAKQGKVIAEMIISKHTK